VSQYLFINKDILLINNYSSRLSSAGIQCYIDKKDSKVSPCKEYWSQFIYFHESPMVKMCYHFVSELIAN